MRRLIKKILISNKNLLLVIFAGVKIHNLNSGDLIIVYIFRTRNNAYKRDQQFIIAFV